MNLIPKFVRLIQGASGLGVIDFAVKVYKTLSSTDGIILGGLMKGKEKLGLRKTEGAYPGSVILTGEK